MTTSTPGALAWSQDRTIVRYPDRKLAVIVLANRTVAEPIELAHMVANTF